MLRDLGQLVVADEDATLPAVGWRDALFEQISRADIEAAIASIDGLVSAPDDRRYQELRPHWRRVRTLFSALLRRIMLDATPAGQTQNPHDRRSNRIYWSRLEAPRAR